VTTSSAITVKVNTNQAPVISITAPVNNAAYMAPASVTFTATATDSDGSISKVEYYNGTTLLGTVTSGSAYSYNWTNVAAGTYTITAKSYDNLNAVTTSSAITVKVTANQSPTVSITSPVTNANVGINESITIHADASDSDGSVVKVEFFNGSTKIGESDRAPYTLAWSASNAGTYTIRVVATDNAGATDEDAITIHANITTGIYNARAIDLNFYPNPAKDVLYFDMAVEKVTVYSINGTIVKNISLNGMDCLTTSDLSSGMYVCEIVTKQGTAFIKILKE
ncbi:MAG TPA: Ig-like domain-containing protein, partial [Cytophaga sp.]|nr:Ig-like domain-containing protein [Cytophaga sp.]